MMNAIMLSFIILSVIMLSVIMLSVYYKKISAAAVFTALHFRHSLQTDNKLDWHITLD
jgi:hypothetical protein